MVSLITNCGIQLSGANDPTRSPARVVARAESWRLVGMVVAEPGLARIQAASTKGVANGE
jgi:hypothetical protein